MYPNKQSQEQIMPGVRTYSYWRIKILLLQCSRPLVSRILCRASKEGVTRFKHEERVASDYLRGMINHTTYTHFQAFGNKIDPGRISIWALSKTTRIPDSSLTSPIYVELYLPIEIRGFLFISYISPSPIQYQAY